MPDVTYRLEIGGPVQGGAHEVNRLVEWARRGPPSAVVTSMDIFPTEGDFVGFEQRESG